MLIRHAEEPSGAAGELGVDERGRRDPEALSVRGWQRAGALVRLFNPPGGHPANEPLARPVALYAATDAGKSRRPACTLQPLAQALGLTVNTRFGSERPLKSFIAELLASAGPVLVAWRHHALPELASALAGAQTTPPRWDPETFDRIWVLRRSDADAAWTFDDLPQRLLGGDAGG